MRSRPCVGRQYEHAVHTVLAISTSSQWISRERWTHGIGEPSAHRRRLRHGPFREVTNDLEGMYGSATCPMVTAVCTQVAWLPVPGNPAMPAGTSRCQACPCSRRRAVDAGLLQFHTESYRRPQSLPARPLDSRNDFTTMRRITVVSMPTLPPPKMPRRRR